MLKLFHFIVDSLCVVAAGMLIIQAIWVALRGYHLRQHYDPKADYAKAAFRVARAVAVYIAFWKHW